MKKQKEKMSPYLESVHRMGRIWTVGALLVLLSVPLIICSYLGVWPPVKYVAKALVPVLSIYWTTAVIEVLTYTPMLGAGGTYLGFVTGNITNLKMPCALNAMENAKVKITTEEGEVISTISIGVSAITTTVIIAVGVLLFAPVFRQISKPESAFYPAFTYVSPALFGALAAGYLRKHWKLCILPVALGILTLVFAPTLAVGTLIFVTIVAAIGGALLLMKLKLV